MMTCGVQHRSSTFALLIAVFSIACFFLHHNPSASAEAYTSLSVQRSRLWRGHRHQQQHPVLSSIPLSNEAHYRALRTSLGVTAVAGGAKSNDDDEKETCCLWNKRLVRELLAEMIGTAMIVGIGTGAVMSAIFTGSLVGLFQVASVWIIAITVAIATTGSVSGAQLNPAISFAFAMVRPKSFAWRKVIPYSVAQLVGAVVASGTNLFLYASKIQEFEKVNAIVRGTAESIASAKAFGQYFESIPSNTMGLMTAFSAETLGTAILAFVVFALTNPKNDTVKNNVFIPPLIGATVGALVAFMAPLTQAGFNPARDFAPRIVAYLAGWKGVALQGWWVYATAPFVGAPIGAFVADKILYGDD